MNLDEHVKSLSSQIEGDVYVDSLHRKIYATDASVYREIPVAVVYPKHVEDVIKIVNFSQEEQIAIIPRGAGTSLAGQVVGFGIVMDCSKYMNQILELNQEEQWVIVEPGVILDELNQYLESSGLFFGPETSTSTHCTIGGMFGNNSCGTHSIIYGSVRDHILAAEVVLSKGELCWFDSDQPQEYDTTNTKHLSQKEQISNDIFSLLSEEKNQMLIRDKYPPKALIRRNTGYALDALIFSKPFGDTGDYNLCKLLAGSEGTLAFTTKLKINLNSLPPQNKALVCVQHESISECCQANLIALKHKPAAVELMDDIILKMARENPIQREKSKFIEGEPRAILMVEFWDEDRQSLNETISAFLEEIEKEKLFHKHTVLYDDQVKVAWDLRKAGLGVLGNMVGDRKPVALIEDTAVLPADLPNYIAEFEELIKKYDNQCVFYAHISVGELHLRPILNLKDAKDRKIFRELGLESAKLVHKYNGSISGEHGDGRLRGEFIPIQYGEEIVTLFREVKHIFDPNEIFNPQKIVDTTPMDQYLRYAEDPIVPDFDTKYDFTSDQGILRSTEKCNGVGYCRKSQKIGGTMCPSFQASRNEKSSTRARANILREELTTSKLSNRFASPELLDALDLCLSCKACKSECPSSVDMTKLKAETLYQSYKTTGVPARSKMIANSPKMLKTFRFLSPLINVGFNLPFVKSMIGFSPKRSIPKVENITLKIPKNGNQPSQKQVTIFQDEFTDLYDPKIAQATIDLFHSLGYQVHLTSGLLSGRSYLSKGLLDEAEKIAIQNIQKLYPEINENNPLIGIEPSAILSFRDEYIDLTRNEIQEQAKELASHCYTFEEFISLERERGEIKSSQFDSLPKKVYLHGHCQQKSLTSQNTMTDTLSMIPDIELEIIPSGCCGMAGSFGYEKEHYDLSMKIGELVLFPTVRKASESDIIVAPGTSCRHQILDGTSRTSLHPAVLLWQQRKKD